MANQILDLKNTLVLDIETASNFEKFEELDSRMKKLWEHKAGLIKNEEELPANELYFKRAGIYAEFGKIITIAVGIYHQIENGEWGLRIKAFSGDDEVLLLNDFKSLLEEKFNQSNLKLCAHNGKEFDIPYLCRRMLVNNIKLPEVLDLSGKKPWEVNHIDTLELWKFGDRKNFTSLDLLSSIFGISSSKEDMDGSMVNQVYHIEGDLNKIVEYCKRDVAVTASLYLKMNAMEAIKEENITMVE